MLLKLYSEPEIVFSRRIDFADAISKFTVKVTTSFAGRGPKTGLGVHSATAQTRRNPALAGSPQWPALSAPEAHALLPTRVHLAAAAQLPTCCLVVPSASVSSPETRTQNPTPSFKYVPFTSQG